jgi:ubiquinone/menaquinone biosynthesis C-methylase UbiE
MHIPASISEDNGLATLTDDDLEIYSVGMSTGGVAEIRMARANPKRQIMATTIDEEGVAVAKKHITKNGLERQIETKLEDVSQPLMYKDNAFDYVYARLVLHYLPEQDLVKALAELHRILKPGGRLFVVVRSTQSSPVKREDSAFDPVTHLTTFSYTDETTGKKKFPRRFFHTEESISKYVRDAGFNIQYVKSYDEDLFVDFMRTIKSPEQDNVIELLAVKS